MTDNLFESPEDIFSSPTTTKVDEDEVSLKTGMTTLAADNLGLQVDQRIISDRIRSGQEAGVRSELAIAEADSINGIIKGEMSTVIGDPTISSEDKIDLLNTLSDNPISIEALAASVLERNASKSLTDSAIVNNSSVALIEDEFMDGVQDDLAKAAIINNILSETGKNLTTGQLLGDLGEMFIPFVSSTYLETDVIPELQKSGWDYEGMEQLRDALFDMPPEEFTSTIKKIEEDLDSRGIFGQNNLNKLVFFTKLLHRGEADTEAMVSRLEQGLDIFGDVLTGIGITTKLARSTKFSRAIKSGEVSVRKVIGDREGASKVAAAKVSNESADLNTLDEVLPDHVRMSGAEDDLNPGISNNVEQELNTLQELADEYNNVRVTERLTEVDRKAIVTEAIDVAASKYNTLARDFIDGNSPGTKGEINVVNRIEDIGEDFHRISQIAVFVGRDGKPFVTAEAASNFAEVVLGLKPGKYSTTNGDKGGVFIRVVEDVPEDGLNNITPLAKLKKGFIAVLSRDLSIDNVLSKFTHLTSDSRGALADISNRILTPISKLDETNMTVLDSIVSKGIDSKGWFSTEDLKNMSFNIKGKTVRVTDDVIVAYHAHKKVNDLYYNHLNNDIVTDLHKAGYKNINIKTSNLELENVNGKVLDTVPDLEIKQFYNVNDGKHLENLSYGRLKELTDDGYKIVRLDRDTDIGEGTYKYILVREGDIEVSNLKRIQLAYTEGGRKYYKGDTYVKQANVRETPGDGPNIILKPSTYHVGTKAEAKEWVDALEGLRKLYNESKGSKLSKASLDAKVQAITSKLNMKINSWEDVRMAFEGVPTMKIKPLYKADQVFEAVKDGDQLTSINKMISDGLRFDPEDIRKTTSMQDMIELKGRGSKSSRTADGLTEIDGSPATLLNAADAATRVMERTAYIRSMKSLTNMMSDKWVKTYGDLIPNDIKKGLNNLQIMDIASLNTMNKDKRTMEALLYKAHFDNFRNVETLSERTVHSIGRWLAEDVLNLGDSKNFMKVKAHEIMTEGNPFKFTKMVAFHETLGFFSPHNWLVQGSAALLAAALEPGRSFKAMGLNEAMTWLMVNRNGAIIDDITKKLAKIPGHELTVEQLRHLQSDLYKSGKWYVKGEMTVNEDVRGIIASKSILAKAGDVSSVPFNAVERRLAIHSYIISWMKWHDDNPGKLLKNAGAEDHGEVSRYADFIVGNMRKSGDTLLQGRGMIGTIFQMTSYPIHFVETFFQTSLTKRQKVQLALSQLALWGPAGVIGASGSQSVSESLIETYQGLVGRELSETEVTTLHRGLVDGIVLKGLLGSELSISQATGPRIGDVVNSTLDMLKGNEVSLTDKVGIGPKKVISHLGLLVDLFKLGASTPDPSIQTIDTGWKLFKRNMEENIGVYSRTAKAHRAYRHGQYISASGKEYGKMDIGPYEAWLFPLGFSTVDATNTWDAVTWNNAYNDDIKATTKIIRNEWRRTLIDIRENPDNYEGIMESFESFMNFNLLGFEEHDSIKIKGDIIGGTERNLSEEVFKDLLETKGINDPFVQMYKGEVE